MQQKERGNGTYSENTNRRVPYVPFAMKMKYVHLGWIAGTPDAKRADHCTLNQEAAAAFKYGSEALNQELATARGAANGRSDFGFHEVANLRWTKRYYYKTRRSCQEKNGGNFLHSCRIQQSLVNPPILFSSNHSRPTILCTDSILL